MLTVTPGFLLDDVTWYANVTTCKIPLIQHEKYNQSGLSGLVIPSEGRPEITIGKLPDGKYYEHGTMQLSIDGYYLDFSRYLCLF